MRGTHCAVSGSNYSSARADFSPLLRCTLSPHFCFPGIGLSRAPSSRAALSRPRPLCALTTPGALCLTRWHGGRAERRGAEGQGARPEGRAPGRDGAAA